MLQQQIMIEKVRDACERDDRLVSALMYGSFAQGEGDEFSDIEFYLFFRDGAVGELDQEAWVSQVAPVALYYVNEFGNGVGGRPRAGRPPRERLRDPAAQGRRRHPG